MTIPRDWITIAATLIGFFVILRTLFYVAHSQWAWLRYRRTGRPPAQVVQSHEFDWIRSNPHLILRPCPFCGRSAETNGIAVWCPTLQHGLMTREEWQERKHD